ncbi:MAG: translation elongation factor Ts [Candidatus Blackburnbacteria bacterium RIFCSPHIGHO2_02_FULL_39_13]|uniref:Elongation factor Ts n=2 Tax=Patescibacteria group TaxID=1783273 RepID=A0A0G1D2G6_9BACT|nr:MAG: Elongation factor Ts [Candidatus Magasanikbacteria bacterium GW2011_GWA2_42_32]OGY07419.1 MAG: translation elongation factor Ts [Candidatus Blackburnbacteria bacterium RIFCSPHIGHO2_01_FULL_40_17]OGY08975.1 MAG: translation elongation factor Ts [Candidatus Blackburnbacteria bacterium RIFCSPHIGHO2_02_FULL_39_13]OGY13398.1 MAG: translation elongation factor Ts [Candidatus Blackburnbacteria bacterium RIFCSPLOWO2_01_FULL_40_20]OGY14706.1 MAG: translation elongation factor Ts [Candidatus Blac
MIDKIKKLRDETAAPIHDIKRALEEAGGDETKAKEILKKSGFAQADKKAARETKAGRVFSYIHHSGTVGAQVIVLCETDFVARTDEFQNLGREIAMQVASMNPESVEELLSQDYIRESGKTIETLIKEVIAKTGENMQIREFKRLEV